MKPLQIAAVWLSLCLPSAAHGDEAPAVVRFEQYDPACGVSVEYHDRLVVVTWPTGTQRQARVAFDLQENNPVVRSIDVAGNDGEFQTVAEALAPIYRLRVESAI